MIMRKFFQYVLMTVTAMMVTSCASDIDGALVKTDKSRTQFVVGDFPAFRDSQTRTVARRMGGKPHGYMGMKYFSRLLLKYWESNVPL